MSTVLYKQLLQKIVKLVVCTELVKLRWLQMNCAFICNLNYRWCNDTDVLKVHEVGQGNRSILYRHNDVILGIVFGVDFSWF